ncbi:MAG: hypothetical protein NZ934_00990, partial [Hadesarchaea archaeon]|nr:hypothetical protein [Hadesarchaea archaeon]
MTAASAMTLLEGAWLIADHLDYGSLPRIVDIYAACACRTGTSLRQPKGALQGKYQTGSEMQVYIQSWITWHVDRNLLPIALGDRGSIYKGMEINQKSDIPVGAVILSDAEPDTLKEIFKKLGFQTQFWRGFFGLFTRESGGY